jgi:prevent-host-death family protein
MGEGGRLVTTGMQTARDKLREFVDAAAEQGQRTVIERHGRPVAVLVSVQDASALLALDANPDLRAELIKLGAFPPPRV